MPPYGWYYRFSTFLKERFGCRVYKIPVDAGFSCPNRDGRLGFGGCIYCYNPSFSPVAGDARNVSGRVREASGLNQRDGSKTAGVNKKNAAVFDVQRVKEQVRNGKLRVQRRGEKKFMVYFQAYTNTYAEVGTLRRLYDAALENEDVVGLAVGTRPDCVPNEVLDLLEEYASNYHVWVEYGLQSVHDETLERINRGHTAEQFFDAVRRTLGRGIYVCAHIIFGLPGESRKNMMETVQALNDAGVHGVKIHHLQVIKHTVLAEEYAEGKVKTLAIEEYVQLVCDALERLSPAITIQRLMGETLKGELLIAPRWDKTKAEVLNAVEKELLRRRSYQGACLEKKESCAPCRF